MTSNSKKYRGIKKDIKDILSTFSENGESPAKVCLLANQPVLGEKLEQLQNPQYPNITFEEKRESGNIFEEAADGRSFTSDLKMPLVSYIPASCQECVGQCSSVIDSLCVESSDGKE